MKNYIKNKSGFDPPQEQKQLFEACHKAITTSSTIIFTKEDLLRKKTAELAKIKRR